MGRVPAPDADRRRAMILLRARAVPEGFVTSYSALSPGAPRLAGTVLASCSDPDVPWHRIVRADGSLAQGARQRRLLEAEGVPFRGARVRIDVAALPAEALDASIADAGLDHPDALGPGA